MQLQTKRKSCVNIYQILDVTITEDTRNKKIPIQYLRNMYLYLVKMLITTEVHIDNLFKNEDTTNEVFFIRNVYFLMTWSGS